MDFNSILIGSADPQRLADFYTRLFGEPMFADGTYTGWLIGSGFLTVGPHSEVTGANPEPGRLIWNIECEDVPATFERFRDAGAPVVREALEERVEQVQRVDRRVAGCGRSLDRRGERLLAAGRELGSVHVGPLVCQFNGYQVQRVET